MENLLLYFLGAALLITAAQIVSLRRKVAELDSENEKLRFYHACHPSLHNKAELYKTLAQEGVVYGLECAEALEAKVAQSLEWGKGYPHIEAAKQLENTPATELRLWAKKVQKAVDQNKAG